MYQLKKTIKTIAPLALLAIASAVAHADPMAYVETADDGFGTLDLSSGTYTNLGNSGSLLSGMCAYNGVIYGGVWHGGEFYSVNTTNGALNPIGNSGITFEETGSTTSGVYGMDQTGELYSVNTANGAVTPIGPTGLSVGGTVGFSSGGSNLYYASTISGADVLYSVDTSTGAATAIGPTGSAQVIGAMVDLGGTLYAGADSPALSVWSLDRNTGNSSNEVATPVPAGYWGLAAAPASTPESSQFLGVGLGIGLLCFRRVKRNKA